MCSAEQNLTAETRDQSRIKVYIHSSVLTSEVRRQVILASKSHWLLLHILIPGGDPAAPLLAVVNRPWLSLYVNLTGPGDVQT